NKPSPAERAAAVKLELKFETERASAACAAWADEFRRVAELDPAARAAWLSGFKALLDREAARLQAADGSTAVEIERQVLVFLQGKAVEFDSLAAVPVTG